MNKHPDATKFVLEQVQATPGRTFPELVRTGRERGLSEAETRTAAQDLLQRGTLVLDEKMRLKGAGTSD